MSGDGGGEFTGYDFIEREDDDKHLDGVIDAILRVRSYQRRRMISIR